MTTKLISANLGIKLVLEKDGKEQDATFSMVCPSQNTVNPFDLVEEITHFLNEKLEKDSFFEWARYEFVPIAKPKKIKAKKYVSQEEFNRRIKEIVP